MDARTAAGQALEERVLALNERKGAPDKKALHKLNLLIRRFSRPNPISPNKIVGVGASSLLGIVVIILTFDVILMQFKVAEFTQQWSIEAQSNRSCSLVA